MTEVDHGALFSDLKFEASEKNQSHVAKVEQLAATVENLNAKLEAAGLDELEKSTAPIGRRNGKNQKPPISNGEHRQTRIRFNNNLRKAAPSPKAQLVTSPYIEDLELPMPPQPGDVMTLPPQAQAWAVLQSVVEEKETIYVSRRARQAMREWFLTSANIQMLANLFWWFCADIFKRSSPRCESLKDVLYRLFSRDYVSICIPYGNTTQNGRPSDTYMQHYPATLAECVCHIFCNVFPKSTYKFDAPFRKAVMYQVLEWSTGMLPYDAGPKNRFAAHLSRSPAKPEHMGHGPAPSDAFAEGGNVKPSTRRSAHGTGGTSGSTFHLTAVPPGTGGTGGLRTPAAGATEDPNIPQPAKSSLNKGGGGLDLLQRSPFVEDFLGDFSLQPEKRAPLTIHRTVAAPGDEEDEDSYATFARNVTVSDQKFKSYIRERGRKRREVVFNRLKMQGDMQELEEYRQMVAMGSNTRKFSNWLSGWTDPDQRAADNEQHHDGGGGAWTTGMAIQDQKSPRSRGLETSADELLAAVEEGSSRTPVVLRKMGGGVYRKLGAGSGPGGVDSRDVMARISMAAPQANAPERRSERRSTHFKSRQRGRTA